MAAAPPKSPPEATSPERPRHSAADSPLADAHQETFFVSQRHGPLGAPLSAGAAEWRIANKVKTEHVGLVMCMNIGYDPPDQPRPKPCARLEAWTDPSGGPAKAKIEQISNALQTQYESILKKGRYEACLDGTRERIHSVVHALRRAANTGRVLLHYNGRGVPRPTDVGEVWCFDENMRNYIPLSIAELNTWLTGPTMYVIDCSNAGKVLRTLVELQRPSVSHRRDVIVLAACGANQDLPMSARLPADLFTACLTTPVRAALMWHSHHGGLEEMDGTDVQSLPGTPGDRTTPLGELFWILTAITDAIAFSSFPLDMYRRLYREDILVAGLCRNYLLAERVMDSYGVQPEIHPPLPRTCNHPLWDIWDMAVERTLAQATDAPDPSQIVFSPNPFFTEQMSAFEMWLTTAPFTKARPVLLPIVVQALRNKKERTRALMLLARFLSLGDWAIAHALQTELFGMLFSLFNIDNTAHFDSLLYMWSRIVALDTETQRELANDRPLQFFLGIFRSPETSMTQRGMAALILTVVCMENPTGAEACARIGLLDLCINNIGQATLGHTRTRLWLTLWLTRMLDAHEPARVSAQRQGPERLIPLLKDALPEIRAAGVLAIASMFSMDLSEARLAIEAKLAHALSKMVGDASPLVRRELALALYLFIVYHKEMFTKVVTNAVDERYNEETDALVLRRTNPRDSVITVASVGSPAQSERAPLNGQQATLQVIVWRTLVSLSNDPAPDVASTVSTALDEAALHVCGQRFRQRSDSGLVGGLDDSGEPAQRTPIVARAAAPVLMRSHLVQWALAHERYDLPSVLVATPESLSAALRAQLATPQSLDDALDEEFESSGEAPDSTPQVRPGPELPPSAVYADVEAHRRMARAAYFKQRNERMLRDAVNIHGSNTAGRLYEMGMLDQHGDNRPVGVLFDPFEPYLYTADEEQTVSLWRYDERDATAISFQNGNRKDSHISSLTLLNEEQDALLCVGSDDGVVRIWRDTKEGNPVLATAWRALPELQAAWGSALLLAWQQQTGKLFAAGGMRAIRLWDVNREAVVHDIPTGSNSAVSALSSDQVAHSTVVAGCADGSVRLFDVRVAPKEALVRTWMEHKDCVISVHLQRAGTRELVSGSAAGDIRVWDARTDVSLRMIAKESSLTAVAVHDCASMVGSFSMEQQHIKVTSLTGEKLSTIEFHDGFLGQRIGPVSCLAFHPHMPLLAAGSTDSIISIYGTQQARNR